MSAPSTKTPWMKFYPGDWQSEITLKRVSRAARSLWLDIICLIHQGGDHRLHFNGENPTDRDLAAVLGDDVRTIRKLLSELEKAGVFSRNEETFIISRRILHDKVKAERDKINGKLGGNPALKNKGLGGSGVNPEDKAQRLEARGQRLEKKERPPVGGPKKPPVRGSRLPPDWRPGPLSERAAADARRLGPDRVDRQLERFRNYWIDQPGQRALKIDWNRTWWNWLSDEAAKVGADRTMETASARERAPMV